MTDFVPHELNIMAHRAPESVWDKRGWNGTRERLTIGRWLVGVGGGALAMQGLRQNTWSGRMLGAMGGGLAYWALTGEGDLSEARQLMQRFVGRTAGGHDPVGEASAESFPASDPPSWTAMGTGVRRDSVR
jgi:hypothetical protein